jgi:hypothetical protein
MVGPCLTGDLTLLKLVFNIGALTALSAARVRVVERRPGVEDVIAVRTAMLR